MSSLLRMKVIYFTEIMSSWCHWVEPVWAELKQRYAGRVRFEWRIALMRAEDFPLSREQCDWFYRRSGMYASSRYMLSSGWLEPELQGDYTAPNLVAEAGRDFGVEDDRLRLALAHAALREGRRIGRMGEACAVGAAALGMSPGDLRERAGSPEVRARVEASTAEFHAHRITQRPAFVIEDPLADKAVFSGLVAAAPLVAAIEAMLHDMDFYAAHRVHFGEPPRG